MSAAVSFGLVVLASCAFGGCVSIDGGAVEASWTVRTPDGRSSSCACSAPQIATIRFEVIERLPSGLLGADACAGKPSCAFPCDTDGRTGATKFDIPPGDYAISLVPLAADGTELRAAVAANPQQRFVVNGRLTELPSFLVEAPCAPACGGDDPTKTCSR